MPCSPRKARLLLKEGKAKVKRRTPFTIQLCFVWGRCTSGSFLLRRLDGTKVKDGASHKNLTLLERSTNYLFERRERCSSPCLKAGVSAA